jgi:hypothetical protein
MVMSFSLLAFGVLWIGKFAIFNAVLFTERPQPRHLRAPSQPRRELVSATRTLRLLVVATTTVGLLLVGSGAGGETAAPAARDVMIAALRRG